MDGKQPRSHEVRLVAFEDASPADAVRQEILELGHSVQTSPSSDSSTGSRQPRASVFVFQCPVSDKQKALDWLTRAEYQPVLGIFACASVDWDDNIINACSEFAGWPCNSRELSYRLERMTGHDYREPNPANEIGVSAEFEKHNLTGKSGAFRHALSQLQKAARYDAPVLIEGETGTGKEMVARALHYMGARANKPFIPVNCGALPDNLIENEFFGHERGAYTGASDRHRGLVVQADGGDLFLDEIGSLSPKAQVTLLRFLESNEFRPLGGSRCRSADVRVIAASNTDLSREVENGSFRPDLYFRLNILSLPLPRLRDRNGDVDLLADYFMRNLIAEFGQRKTLSMIARARMKRHSWPGNVRELKNLLRREFLLCDGTTINFDSLADVTQIRAGSGEVAEANLETTFNEAKAEAVASFERKYLYELMEQVQGNVSQAARIAGKERRALGRLLKKHGIDKTIFY